MKTTRTTTANETENRNVGETGKSRTSQSHSCLPDRGESIVRKLSTTKPPTFELALSVLTLCSQFFVGPLYGFNVYVIPLLEAFSGKDDTSSLTMKDGNPVYISGLAIFVLSATTFVIGDKLQQWGLQRTLAIGHVLSIIGLVISFVAMRYSQLWLFYVGYAIIFGIGGGLTCLPSAVNNVKWWGARHNLPGVGSGIYGFIAGIWPALFSFYGVAIADVVGVAYSFLVLAALVVIVAWWTPIFTYTPDDVEYTKKRQHLDNESQRNAGPEGAHVLTNSEMMKGCNFWLILVVFFLAVLPGFGVKLVISPMLKGVYDASSQTQSAVSALFLVAYAAGRLCWGPLSDKLRANRLLATIMVVQIMTLGILGAQVWYASDGKSGVWSFAVVNMFLGITMSGFKVILPVYMIVIFGEPNLSAAIGNAYLGLGLAAFAGPVFMWWTLVSTSENLTGIGSDATTFTHCVSYFFWVTMVGTLVALITLIFVKPYTFQTCESTQENSTQDGQCA
jgi:MFS transporter, OFA family, oxalate/formate antiporter